MTEFRYRIQFAEEHRFANWSDWRPYDQPIIEPFILSLQFEPPPTDAEMREFWRRNFESEEAL